MKVVSKFRKFQEGGPVEAAPQEAPQDAQGSPMDQILNVAAQAVQTQNCEAAMAVCQTLIQLASGGGQAAPAEEPTFARNGAKIVRIR